MNKPIEKYIKEEDLKKMPINQVKVCKQIYTTYKNVGNDDMMLLSALKVYTRLFPAIGSLPEMQQLDIVHEATMIAYDARTKAFEHMINYNPNNEKNNK